MKTFDRYFNVCGAFKEKHGAMLSEEISGAQVIIKEQLGV